MPVRRHMQVTQHLKSPTASNHKNHYPSRYYCAGKVEVRVTGNWLTGSKKQPHAVPIALTTFHVTRNTEQF
jgi:hypothetical protein